MKQLAAILLSAVLLFNWYGFQPLMNWLDDRADAQMSRQLDEQQYDESSLIEISVPTNLPYTQNWASFERVDGSVEFNGRNYSYVMRKMVDGKMIYKCIPNENRNKISNARDAFFKLSFDADKVTTSKKQDGNKSPSVKKTMDDFTEHNLRIAVPASANKNPSYLIANILLANGFNVLPYHPPQA
ncbi:MAG: hypothetical protein V4722_05140 [Bacteroidota bacterium]